MGIKYVCEICGWEGFNLPLHKSIAHEMHTKMWYKNKNYIQAFKHKINNITDLNYLNEITDEILECLSSKLITLSEHQRIDVEEQEKRYDELLAMLRKEPHKNGNEIKTKMPVERKVDWKKIGDKTRKIGDKK